MSGRDLRELYQAIILDHNKNPRNFGAVEDATHAAHGDNPLCGDKLALTFCVDDGVVADVKFAGDGCAISKASASMLTQTLRGRDVADARQLIEAFHRLITGEATPEDPDRLGKLAVFATVSQYPARVKCASLAWHTARAALDGDQDVVSTE